MWIILEGPDGAGKTGLQEAILEKHESFTGTHMGPPRTPTSALAEVTLEEPFNLYMPGQLNLVSDRHHWGCPVYGPIFRPEHSVHGYGDFGPGGWRFSELFVASRGGIVVHVTAALETLKERLGSRGDWYIDLDDLPKILENYNKCVGESITWATTLHSTNTESGRFSDEIVDYVLRLGSTAEMRALIILRSFPSYVGPVNPKKLVLVDTHQQAVELMHNCSPRWQTTGFVPPISYQRLRNLHETLQRPKVVCGSSHGDSIAFAEYNKGTFPDDLKI